MLKFKSIHRKFRICILFLLTTTLTGCFEIVHELNLNADGSGNFNLILNLSRSKSKIDMLLLLDEINGHKIPSIEEVDQKFSAFTDSARVSRGITAVKSSFDKEKFILEFSCEFDKISRINNRLYEVWKQIDTTEAVYEKYYTFDGQQYTQNLSNRVTKMFNKLSAADREVLVGADYTSILRFENEIASQNNSAAKIAPNNKVIFLQSPILGLVQKPILFNNIVKIKV